MESLVLYLIYVLGVLAAISIVGCVFIKVKSMDIKKDIIDLLSSRNYETDKIDLDKYIK